MASRGQNQSKQNRQQQQQQPLMKTKQNTEEPPLKSKRTHSDVSNESNTSMHGLSLIQTQLDEMTESIGEVKDSIQCMLKKEDIEDLIIKTVSNIMSRFEKQIQEEVEKKVNEKTQHLLDKIDSLEFDKNQLTDQLKSTNEAFQTKVKKLEEQIKENERHSKDAIKCSNHNEQYSRKNNIKIMDIPEDVNENASNLIRKVSDIFTKQNIEITDQEIMALHRIPTRKGGVRPVLMKTLNNNVKSRIMRKRKEMKNMGHRLVDDVTAANTGLINRLQQHPNLESSWYFNGAVYGMTLNKQRIKFDLYDNVSEVIATARNSSYKERR